MDRGNEMEWTTVTFLVSVTTSRVYLMLFWTMAAPVHGHSEKNSVYGIYTGYHRLSQ